MAVTDDPRPRHNVRARPVVDLPIEPLLAGAGELAKRWAVALILSRPLEEVAAVPLETLVDEGSNPLRAGPPGAGVRSRARPTDRTRRVRRPR